MLTPCEANAATVVTHRIETCEGATPQSLVSVYRGRDAGYTPMPGGTHLDLAAPTMMASILTDSQGEASVDSWIGAAYAGTPVRLQAMDDQGNRSAPLYFVIQ